MIVDNNARKILAHQLNDTLVGEPFSYEDSAGKQTHARIAAVETNGGSVDIYLDGVVVNGSTRILTLRPTDELWFSPDPYVSDLD
ncbi:hypothetical protein [Streptomyces sp. NRRL B-24720]|uniref:hypothetical protein n=1 Tax=Streptomyces sp. NRRL B-24720 TaxID=1476876 RepID=UPI0004C6489D|nr:hypothetical protein [Streptomyces sp. NRRL B-24720]